MTKINNSGIEFSYFSLKGFSELQWYAAILVAVSTLLVGWTSIMNLLGYNVSFSNIVYLHNYIFVWLFDFAIALLVLGALYVSNFRRIKLGSLLKDVKSLENQIDTSIQIAEKIRNGEAIDEQNQDGSQLGSKLLDLGLYLQKSQDMKAEFDWVSRGKEKISDILRKHTQIEALADEVLEGIVSYANAVQAAFYIKERSQEDGYEYLQTVSQYAYDRKRYEKTQIRVGQGLIGACAYEHRVIYRNEIPEDYFTITSGLINLAKPKSLLIIPLKLEDNVLGVIEISFFEPELSKKYLDLAEEIGIMLGSTINNLRSRANTERLLREVQNEQNKQKAMLRNASEFISIYDANMNLVFESESVKHILGYNDDEEVLGFDINTMSTKSWSKFEDECKKLIENPDATLSLDNLQIVDKEGNKIFLQVTGKNLLGDPAVQGILLNTRDVTAQRAAKIAERDKGRMQSLSDNSNDLIMRFEVDKKHKAGYSNAAAQRFVHGEIKGKKLKDLDCDADLKQLMVDSVDEVAKTKNSVVNELKLKMENEEVTLEVVAIPEFKEVEEEHDEENGAKVKVTIKTDEVETVLITAHDITYVKRLEEEAREKTKKMQDSINYALRIQQALLPVEANYQEAFPNAFMFYRPKDIVSGDFPWYYNEGDIYYIAAVDCTGHGVPGALLSIIGSLLLKFIVSSNCQMSASEVLTHLHANVRATLKQYDAASSLSGDGMDMGLLRIDRSTNELQFAGAHRPLYFLRGGEFTEYKATSKGIGGKPLPGGRAEKDFENNVIQCLPGDRCFVFSDGLPDQLGGGVHKKFQTKRVKELLLNNTEESMQTISQNLIKEFYDWVGDEHQVDDVLLIGIEI